MSTGQVIDLARVVVAGVGLTVAASFLLVGLFTAATLRIRQEGAR